LEFGIGIGIGFGVYPDGAGFDVYIGMNGCTCDTCSYEYKIYHGVRRCERRAMLL